MSKVTITIEDLLNGGLDINVESDPGFPGPAAEDQTMTDAQYIALNVLMSVHEERKNGPLKRSFYRSINGSFKPAW